MLFRQEAPFNEASIPPTARPPSEYRPDPIPVSLFSVYIVRDVHLSGPSGLPPGSGEKRVNRWKRRFRVTDTKEEKEKERQQTKNKEKEGDIPRPVCRTAADPEHLRGEDEDEPCDDARGVEFETEQEEKKEEND
jgi:hypothetical protein